jgi:aryl-alcohol dehydrogenase-like predicted oxidoreductase
MIAGFANVEGTTRYGGRFPKLRDAGHFREARVNNDELWLSSIGAGTYLGEPNDEADAAYTAAIGKALTSGINVLDTAINYRHQRSERNIGAALEHAIKHGALERDEVLVCTKAGFLTFDADVPANPQAYFMENYFKPGILRPSDIAGGMHAMSASYLENQVERSRKNLRLETIDVFYVHNPESQLAAGISRDEFRKRLADAFARLERAVAAGKIRYYGSATWNGFRAAPEARDYLSLEEISLIAQEAGGAQHHCRFLQLPFNLAMPEAFASQNQSWDGEMVSVFEAAKRAGMLVVGSATLHQARLIQNLPEKIRKRLGTSSDLEAAIQFARSAPGITTSLIGMGNAAHVAANIAAVSQSPVAKASWIELFQN